MERGRWREMDNVRIYLDTEPNGLMDEWELGSRVRVKGIKTLVWGLGS